MDFRPTCDYTEYQCSLPRVDNSEFCIRHILGDSNTIYKSCTHVFPNPNLKCFRAASKYDRDGSCHIHASQKFRSNQKLQMKSHVQENPEICLQKLSHHRMLPVSSISTAFPDPNTVPAVSAKLMEYKIQDEEETEELEEVDIMTLPRIEDDSDIDMSSDSESLNHLGAFTEEEMVNIYLEKLKKLRELYVDQFDELKSKMKDNKKEYMLALQKEKETMMKIYDQPKDTMDEKKAFKELKALVRYHRLYGEEALLKNQQPQNLENSVKSTLSKGCVNCVYSEGSWKCRDQSVPLSKYCFKHILQDPSQVLFKKCNAVHANEEECSTPVPSLPLQTSCVYHMPLPKLTLPSNQAEEVVKCETNTSVSMPIVNLNDSSAFFVTELPPENVMEEDSIKNN